MWTMKRLGLVVAAFILSAATGLGQNNCIEWQGTPCVPPPDDGGRFNAWMLTSSGNWKNIQFDEDWGVAQTVYSGESIFREFYSHGNNALYAQQFMFYPVLEEQALYVFDLSNGRLVGRLHDGDDEGLQVVAEYIAKHTTDTGLWLDIRDGFTNAADGRCRQATLDSALAGGGVILAMGAVATLIPLGGPITWQINGLTLTWVNFANAIGKEMVACQVIPPPK